MLVVYHARRPEAQMEEAMLGSQATAMPEEVT
jgi:hypothetical protein